MYHIVEFIEGKNNSIITRINGKIAFLHKKSVQPQINEKWLVEIVGENKNKTVYFVKCLVKIEPTKEAMRKLLQYGAEEYPIYDMLFGKNKVRYFLNGNFVEEVDMAEYPEYMAEYNKMLEKEEKEAEEYKKKMLEEVEKIKKLIKGYSLETIEVFADSYKIEILHDEDWGLHKADNGYKIRVWPVYEKAEDYNSSFRKILNIIANKFGTNEHDLIEAAEDEAMFIGYGPNMAIMDLAKDIFNKHYAKIIVKLTPQQIKEIDAKYKDRDNTIFTTEKEYYIKKKYLKERGII